MKKIYIILIIGFFIITGCGKVKERTYLLDYGDYAKIKEDNIKEIKITKYTVAGSDSTYVNEDFIKNVYNNFKKIKIGDKTNMTCEDNTTVYTFVLTDNSEITIEKECDWLVIGKERYKMVKEKEEK
jgi:hypothetical protein